MQCSALIPLLLSAAGFVLALLSILAGHKRGFMEDYHVVLLNTSTLGHNLIPNDTTPTSTTNPSATATSWESRISDALSSAISTIEGDIENDLNKIAGDVADKLSQELGISQWYSLHMTDLCEGKFNPNATAHGAKLNVTNCTASSAGFKLNLSETINTELQLGPFQLNLSDIGWPSDIQDDVNKLNKGLEAFFIVYVIGAAAAALAIIGALAVFVIHSSPFFAGFNFAISTISWLALLVGSIIATVAVYKAVDELNDKGNSIGLYAYRGTKFLFLSWFAFVAMILAGTFWILDCCSSARRARRDRRDRRAYKEKWANGR